MSVLLRHPATVPALFSRALDPEPLGAGTSPARRRLAGGAPLLWAAVALLEIPPLKAAFAAAVLAALPP